jgi:hypothetical protein
LSTLHVQTVEPTDPPGKLCELITENGNDVPAHLTIPRITNAIWRWEGGGVGHFIHGVSFHEGSYDVELVVLADGWKMRLVDPYGVAPKLYVRRPGSGEEGM